MNNTLLLSRAKSMRARAIAPYSGFTVGAALLAADGTVYTGANIENAAYPVCCCAERVALFKALSEGARQFTAMAVAGGKSANDTAPCFPCGVYRQALLEYCDPKAFTVWVEEDGVPKGYTLDELLPHGFRLEE